MAAGHILICPPCEGIMELLKGAGSPKFVVVSFAGNELVAVAKSAGLSPILVESYDETVCAR